jgi:hypothetical protein
MSIRRWEAAGVARLRSERRSSEKWLARMMRCRVRRRACPPVFFDWKDSRTARDEKRKKDLPDERDCITLKASAMKVGKMKDM